MSGETEATRVADAMEAERCSTPELWEIQSGWLPVVRVPISAIAVGESPRLDGESSDHVDLLARSTAVLPPIVVHRQSMRVIDGMHRLRAAIQRGQQEIDVQFFDGDENDVFVLSVKQNVSHGLPLTRADRNAAAMRIISSHPHWSDRMIAAAVGLSPKTVMAIRVRGADRLPTSATRIGRDGRVRLVDRTEGRRITSEFVVSHPEATLKEIARNAGVSLATARDVRARIRRGESPLLPGRNEQTKQNERAAPVAPSAAALDPIQPRIAAAEALPILRRDPSVCLNDQGRLLLRVLSSNTLTAEQWTRLVESFPAHWAGTVAAVARQCAETWSDVASRFQQRAGGEPDVDQDPLATAT